MIPCHIFLAVPVFSGALKELWDRNMATATLCTLDVYTDAKIIAFMDTYATLEQNEAFATLVPWAYKVDLWRAVALHTFGGIYIDADTELLKLPEEVVDLSLDEVQIPRDRNPRCLFNGVVAANKGNRHIKRVIDRIVHNIQQRVEGYADGGQEPWLGITGPCTYGAALLHNFRALGSMHPDGIHIGDFARRVDVVKTEFSDYYAELWGHNKIYRPVG